jgi:prevent-host-death family protein
MLAMPSAEAQNRFGELLDLSQREPVQITRRGRPVACVVSMQDMEKWDNYRRQAAVQWFDDFHAKLDASRSPAQRAAIANATEEDIYAMVRDARNGV